MLFIILKPPAGLEPATCSWSLSASGGILLSRLPSPKPPVRIELTLAVYDTAVLPLN